jgi:glycosyltransferase involved in cell wall biosynthesis
VLAGGGFFFDPRDARQLEEGLRRALTQPEQRALWAKAASERAAALSWAATARATHAALDATLERAAR